jgi:SAM-dependent methyltransferase
MPWDCFLHPLARGQDIDAPKTTSLRKLILRQKRFLRMVYEEWYQSIANDLPTGSGQVLEIGSGAGFLPQIIPEVITSELFPVPDIQVVLDACRLPLASASLRAIVMTDVLHHIPEVRRFLAEASRCVRAGGRIVMVEPWHTRWSRWVYTRLHPEPFRPNAEQWEFPATGPLSGANGALPWILFDRDRSVFEAEYPQWRIATIQPCMPFRYLLSGGVSYRGLMPALTFSLWRGIESGLRPWNRWLAMFAKVVLERRPS